MRIPALIVLAVLVAGAAPPAEQTREARFLPGYKEPAKRWKSVEDGVEYCRDRIEQVRESSGQPQLDRAPASPDKPLLIAAVDHRLNGCSVLVMRNDTSDIRPLPAPPDDVGLMPAQ